MHGIIISKCVFMYEKIDMHLSISLKIKVKKLIQHCIKKSSLLSDNYGIDIRNRFICTHIHIYLGFHKLMNLEKNKILLKNV